ncbi:MAG TPA: amino acid adenylation domain-containing protein [Herpetosiphonaceae bacterium]
MRLKTVEDFYPLAPMQQGMLFHSLHAPTSGVYVEQLSCTLHGDLNIPAFERAWQQLVDRYPILRTAFVWEGIDEPVQLVHRQVAIPLEQQDWRGISPMAQAVRLETYLHDDKAQGFDLTRVPLMRFALFRIADDAYFFVWTFHHILLDGWSVSSLIEKVLAAYESNCRGRELRLAPSRSYRDYIVWLRQQDQSRAEAFWRRMLRGITAPTQLGIGSARSAEEATEGYVKAELLVDAATTAALQTLARQQQVTISTLVQGAWALVLSRYSGEQDVVFGVTVSGRPPTLTGSDAMVGLFINTLPLRVHVDAHESLRAWLETLQAQQVELRQYEYSALVQVQGWSDVPRGQPLFDHILVFENYPMDAYARASGGNLRVSDLHFSEQSNYPLTIAVEPGTELKLQMNYDQRRFSATAIERLLRHFQMALEQIVARPEQRLGDVQIVGEAERREMLVAWNTTAADYALDRCVHELVEAQVARTPDATALVFEDRHLTYDEVNRRANQVARHLRSLGVGPDARVGLCLHRSPELLIGLLGVLKAGGAYVPLDPAYPADRLAYMAEDARIGVLLTAEPLREHLPQTEARIVCLDADWPTIARQPADNVRSGVDPDNLAYVMYTSGSTGRPKGVQNSHRAIGNRLLWNQQIYPLSAADRVLQIASFSFDISLWELVGPLLAGAQVIMGRPGGQQDSGYLVRLIAEQQVTVAHFVPSLLHVLLEEPGLDGCDALRGVFCGGEALPRDLPDRFFARLDADLIQFYGPTEASINATAWVFERDVPQQGVPIGCPIANMQIYLLDRQLNPVPVGVAGELHIGGVGLARGYSNRPDLTAERFIPDPFSQTGDPQGGARLYKTGDLARYREDGVLEFLGRLDFQIKVRGFRVEPGEIEAVLQRHPDVREAMVLAREDRPGDTRLVAYVVPSAAQAGVEGRNGKLTTYLKQLLPDYMVPAAFVFLDALPLTPNGKVDRRALPTPEQGQSEREGSFAAPHTPTEEVIAGIWAAVLKIERVGIHDSFFALGGHSLVATQIMSRVRDAFGIDLPLGALFDTPTVAGLAGRVEQAQRAAQGLSIKPIERVSREQPLPLSFAQQRLWFLDQLQPGSAAYNIPAAVQMSGTLHITALHQSLNTIVRRHEALRTTFIEQSGDPVQVIAPSLELPLPVVDLSGRSTIERELAVLRHTSDEAQTPFDLQRGPLIRTKLLRLDEQEHVVLITVHHIVSDGWSVGVFLRELATLYDAFVDDSSVDPSGLLGPVGTPPPIQYADFAVWQRAWLQGEVLEQQLGYWKQQLGGALPLLELPTDHPRPAVQTFKGARHRLALPRQLSHALLGLSQREGVTLYMTLLAALQVLLQRYTRQDDLLIGTPTAGRTQRETENLIGFFVNTLVLRTDLSGNPTFRELLKRVRKVALESYAHQDLPFEQLVDAIQPQRDLSRSALFQVLFALQNAPMPNQSLRDLTLASLEIDNGTAKFDLALDLTETAEGIGGFIEYNTDLFEPTTIERMAAQFQTVLESIVSKPTQRIADVTILPEHERQQVLVTWNATAANYSRDVCLHTLIEAQVERTPDATAVTFEGQALTYAALNARANQLAHHLRSLGVGPETRVAVCMERSLELVVSLLAVLKAGGCYVPLDPDYPQERLHFMLGDAAAPVLLTQAPLLLPEDTRLPTQRAKVVSVDSAWDEIARQPATNPALRTGATNLAYMIYTSGSTGQPKGAMNTHQAIVNRLLWMQDAYRLDATDRVLQKTPFSFDVSVWEFFWPLLTGATLVVARPGGHQDPAYLVELIAHERITTLHFVPSMLQVFLEERDLDRCQSLRRVICSGEALPLALQQRFFARLDAELHNLYGPTEAAVDVTFWPCHPDRALHTVPIGYPVANTQIYLLDRHLHPVPIGVPGELHIGGIQLARGYHRRPALTAERFIPDPFSQNPGARLYRTGDLARSLPDGAIEYLGRLDFQVKVRGFRIELGEIETALTQHPQVREAVVTARQDTPPAGGHPDARLVAYVVAQQQHGTAELSVSALRRFLEPRLPEYMVPSAFVFLDALPLTPNGKIDRKALPAPDSARPELEATFVAPQTPEEEALAAIWQNVLGLERVGIHDNFFALGGDSMRSIRVLSQARDRGFSLSLQQLFQHQTIGELARMFGEQPSRAVVDQPVVPFSLITKDDRLKLPGEVEDAYPLSALQVGMLFHSEYQPDSAVYHDIFTQHIRTPFDADALRVAIRDLVARHPILRTGFDLTNYSQPLQLVYRTAQPLVEIDDLRACSPAEQDAALLAAMEAEKRRPFDWRRAPLLRFQIQRRADDAIQFTVSFHHSILDGWSVAAMNTELFTLYFAHLGLAAPALAAPPASGFRDFIALEQQALASQETRAYWTRTLSDSTSEAIPRWPADGAQPAQRQIQTHDVALTPELSNGLKRLAQQAGVPLKSVLLAAHLRVLSVLHGRDDVLTGLVSHGRPETEDSERILGMFLNTLPFRLSLAGGTWLDLVRATFAAERELLPHRWYPMAEIQRSLGGQDLFETAFNYIDFHVYQRLGELPGFRPMGGQFFQETNFPLSANFGLDQGTGHLQLGVEYDAAEIPEAQANAIAGYYARALAAMVAEPDARYDRNTLLSEAERRQLIVGWNATATEYPQQCLHQLFEAQAMRTPDAIAVLSGDQTLSYRALNERANQLAHHLRSLGVRPESRVALCVERSPDLIVGLLGILKAGGCYVPLDPAYPQERLAFMMEDAQVSVLLTQAPLLSVLPDHHAQVVRLDADWPQIAQQRRDTPSSGAQPDNLAYMIYTSGSTGRPKGVLVPHRGLGNLAQAQIRAFGVTPDSRVLQFASFSFDASISEICMALLAGATLCLGSQDAMVPGPAALNVLREQAITVATLPPSVLAVLTPSDFPSLQSVIAAGEACPATVVARWATPERRFLNAYGPTETTVCATIAGCRDGSRTPPIGPAIANMQVYVLDQQRQPSPVGIPGEVYIGGVGVARGYHGRADLTAERFVPNPFSQTGGTRLYRTGDLARYLPNGDLDYIGRIDQQVKVRGFRIELGEIEAVLRRHAAVRDTVVLLRADQPSAGGHPDKRLVAYVVGAQRAENAEPGTSNLELGADLRRSLLEQVPEYMVPSAFVFLDALPLTPNGKIDRKALPAPDSSRAGSEQGYVAPRTPTEQTVARILSDILVVERVGVHDNFFELGGHSLLAMQLISRLRDAFQVELPLRILYESATVADLALAIVQKQAEQADNEALDEMLAELDQLSDEEVQALLASGEGRDE